MLEVPPPIAAWRLVEVHDHQVLQARLLPGLAPQDPPVQEWLRRWRGRVYTQPTPEGVEVMLTRRNRPRTRERWWLHALLLALTLVTTTVAGGILAYGDPLRFRPVAVGGQSVWLPTDLSPGALAPALGFSLALLAVLAAHELGHYWASRWHGMDVSPPYFLPAPWLLSPIGTFGAFIRLRSPLLNRAVLLDVGASGPLAGFLVSLPVTLVGLWLSLPVPLRAPLPSRIGILNGNQPLALGEPLAMAALRMLSPVADAPFVLLHPLAVAGWFGFLLTTVNLLPIGQLDGGHIAFALRPRAHRIASFVALGILLLLGLRWAGWLVWAVLVLALGRGRVAHPPVFDAEFRLDPRRRALAWLCAVLLLLCLVPVPFHL